jgi:hypothetical protein
MKTPRSIAKGLCIAQPAALARITRRRPAAESSMVEHASGAHFRQLCDARPTAAVDITGEQQSNR